MFINIIFSDLIYERQGLVFGVSFTEYLHCGPNLNHGGKFMDGNDNNKLQLGLMEMECARVLWGTEGPIHWLQRQRHLFPNISETVAASWTVYLSKVTTLTRFIQAQSCPWMYEVCCA